MKTTFASDMRITVMVLAMACVVLSITSVQAAQLAFDDFSTYNEGVDVNGQNGGGALIGFGTTTWAANAGVQVNSDALNQGGNLPRSRRAFSTTPLASASNIYIRANLALSDAALGVNFSALELATTLGSADDSVRFHGYDGGLFVDVYGAGGASTGSVLANDGANHEWVVEIDLDTRAGQVWIDPNTAAFNSAVGGTAFTAPSGFTLNGINIVTAGGSSSVVVDDIRIGASWSDIGVSSAQRGTLFIVR